MKRNVARTIALAALSLGLAMTASAQDRGPCTMKSVAGDWGYTKTGTLYTPAGVATPFATMGVLRLDSSGTLTGVNTGSVGGAVSQDVLVGIFEVNPDCTGAMTVEVKDQNGALLRTISMALVIDDNLTQMRGLMTALVLPNGVGLRTVITAEARRVVKNHGQ
jgi:hypothetical protein